MISEEELIEAIVECENARPSYQMCEKLATFYAVHDHLYPKNDTVRVEQEVVGDYGESKFLSSVKGHDASEAWRLMDELMSAVQITIPKLYEGVLSKLA